MERPYKHEQEKVKCFVKICGFECKVRTIESIALPAKINYKNYKFFITYEQYWQEMIMKQIQLNLFDRRYATYLAFTKNAY